MTNFSVIKIIQEELSSLRPKEEKVIRSRFGIGLSPQTLAAIGRDMKLSRERVRQIEKEALRKLSLIIVEKYDNIIQNIVGEFERNGGVILKKELAKEILRHKEKISAEESNALNLLVVLLPQIKSIERDHEFEDSWILASVPKDKMAKVLRVWATHLQKSQKPERIEVLIKENPDSEHHKISILTALPRVSKKIIETYEGSLALVEWPEYNPKTIRDKIYYVLKKNQSPMHFTEIARAIKNEQFDNKKVVVATVHNELISDQRFVLVGRGMYALAEWGYKEGTVKKIIAEILKKSGGALSLKDLCDQVMKQRMVKRNTILINLQTQKQFKKIGRDKYILVG